MAKTKAKPKTPERDERGRFVPSVDVKALRVTGSELAAFLGVTQSAVTQSVQAGTVSQGRDGKFALLDTVRDYIKRLRSERQPSDKDGLDAQQAFWKTEKLKQQVRSWRVQRDRATALAVVEQIRSAMLQLRERLKDVRGIGRDFDELLAAVDNVDIDAACAVVEGEDEEDE